MGVASLPYQAKRCSLTPVNGRMSLKYPFSPSTTENHLFIGFQWLWKIVWLPMNSLLKIYTNT